MKGAFEEFDATSLLTRPVILSFLDGRADLSSYSLRKPPGRYQVQFQVRELSKPVTLTVILEQCPPGRVLTTGEDVTCNVCGEGSVASKDGLACKKCPSSIGCEDGKIKHQRNIWIWPGNLANNRSQLRVLPCPRDVCLDNGECSVNRLNASINPLCGVCLDHYMEILGQCEVRSVSYSLSYSLFGTSFFSVRSARVQIREC